MDAITGEEIEILITAFNTLPPFLKDMTEIISNTQYGQVVFTLSIDKGNVTDMVTTSHVRKRYSGN
jgi:hypothetical protein